jgi:hypothetical protein
MQLQTDPSSSCAVLYGTTCKEEERKLERRRQKANGAI